MTKSYTTLPVPSVVMWHSEHGQKIGLLVKVGRDYQHIVLLDDGLGVRVVKVPSITYDDKGRTLVIRIRAIPYNTKHAADVYLTMGERWGITNAAEAALREIAQ